MNSTKPYSKRLDELRIKLGIKSPQPKAEIENRMADFRQRVDWVVQKSKKRPEIAGHNTRGPQYRWTPEEDEKLTTMRASGLKWTSIAKELDRTPRAVEHRFLRQFRKRMGHK